MIGRDNALPWRLPDDLKRFKQLTMGKPVVMGRKTFESIGKPLPGRLNIVVTRQPDFEATGCTVVSSIDEAFRVAGSVAEISVIGGADIYRQILPRTDVIHLTLVHAQVAGDAYLPALDAAEWQEVAREEHPVDERHAYAFSFQTLERKNLERRNGAAA